MNFKNTQIELIALGLINQQRSERGLTPVDFGSTELKHRKTAMEMATAAYEASALKHVEGMVEALSLIIDEVQKTSGSNPQASRYSRIRRKALAALPKELGGSDE